MVGRGGVDWIQPENLHHNRVSTSTYPPENGSRLQSRERTPAVILPILPPTDCCCNRDQPDMNVFTSPDKTIHQFERYFNRL